MIPQDNSPVKNGKHQEAEKGIAATAWYLIGELQLLTPFLLIGFAIATIIFIILDSVDHNKDLKAGAVSDAVFLCADVIGGITNAWGTNITAFPVVAMIEINRLRDNSEVYSLYAPQVEQAAAFVKGSDPRSAVSLVSSVQAKLTRDVVSRSDKLQGSGGLYYSAFLNGHLTHTITADLMQMSEGPITAARGLKATGSNAMCSFPIVNYFTEFFPDAISYVNCDNTASFNIQANSAVSVTLDPKDFTGINAEMEAMHLAYDSLLTNLWDISKNRNNSSIFVKQIVILAIALFIAVLGIILTIMLVISQHRSLHEQSIVESDFDCNAQRVKIRYETLRMVDEIASKIGVMGHLLEDSSQRPSANQIELHLRRALEPLQMLRPFVPNYMYLKSFRSMSLWNTHSSALFRNTEMLNLTIGLSKKPVSILYVGLRGFNKSDADLGVLNELLGAVHLACSHFQGNVVQVSSEGLVALFTRATLNEDEGDERVEDGEVLAIHAALAVQEIANAPLEGADGVHREPFTVSMAVVHAISFMGIVQYHVTKSLTLLSPAVSHAMQIEPLNDVHGSSVLTTSATNDLISGHFITRPVHYVQGVGSVYQVVAEEPSEDTPNRETIIKEQTKLKEKTKNWTKAWEKYEALVSTDKPTYEMLEDAYRDLEGYKVFQMTPNEHDVAFNLAVTNVKRIAQHLGVNLGATVEEE